VVVVVRSLGVLGYAAVAVGRWHEPVEAAADDAFAKLAGNVGDAWDGGTVLAHGGVRGQRHHTTATAFEIALGVDALPGARTTAIDAAGYPAESLLRAGATAEPATPVAVLTIFWLVRGTSAARHALAVADHRGRIALALLGLHNVVESRALGKRESVRALESAGVTLGTDGRAVRRVRAVRVGGGLMEQLRQNFGDFFCSRNRDGLHRDRIGLKERRNVRLAEAGNDRPNCSQFPLLVGDHERRVVEARAYIAGVLHVKCVWWWVWEWVRG